MGSQELNTCESENTQSLLIEGAVRNQHHVKSLGHGDHVQQGATGGQEAVIGHTAIRKASVINI